jgi:TPP-dependent pyruvate/acetoin dehydrogenase alpha subunit
MPAEIVDGQDVDAVFSSTSAAVERARSGGGPTLLEMKTYRYKGHSRSDAGRYRPAGELEAWEARDPVDIAGSRLVLEGLMTTAERDAAKLDAQAQIDSATEAALAAPRLSFEEASELVYAD